MGQSGIQRFRPFQIQNASCTNLKRADFAIVKTPEQKLEPSRTPSEPPFTAVVFLLAVISRGGVILQKWRDFCRVTPDSDFTFVAIVSALG